MALNNMGVSDVTGVEIVDSIKEALFPLRIVGEMERTVRNGGVCVVAVKECGGEEVDAIASFLCQSKKGFKRHNYCLPMKKSKLSVGKYTIFPLMVSNMFGMKLSCLPALANGVWQWRKSQLAIRHLIFQRYGALQCQIYDMALTPSVPKKCSKIFVQSSDINSIFTILAALFANA
ncbi:hypothetical protein NC652_031914 [Populus alba x Populus x berolinensis]|nr:hypothetical protein NC652_031914 [Populus alba x Populus x berolinensis]